MEIPCVFRQNAYLNDKIAYACEFTNQFIPENIQIIPQGSHLINPKRKGSNRNNNNIIGVIFYECKFTKVPQGLIKIFPNMKILSIEASNIKDVTKTDLAEYKNLERISFCNNEIEFLPGNLFEGFKHLEEASFNEKKLKLVEPNILDGLNKLKNVCFKDNQTYTKYFSEFTGCHTEPNATLDEVKDELFVRFYKDNNKIENFQKIEEEYKALKGANILLNHDNRNLKNKVNSLNDQNLSLKTENQKLKKSLQNSPQIIQTEIKYFLQVDDAFKDFRIQIEDREFPVHKILLAARSPTLAEILKNNPEVENLNLVDISVEIFEIILKFLYTDELPGDDGTNFMHLFAAAGKLQIKELKNYAAEKIIDNIEEENALDILKISIKYEHDELRFCAYGKIKRENPKIEFKDEWSKNVDTIVKIIEAFKMKEEAIKKVEEEFKNLIIKS